MIKELLNTKGTEGLRWLLLLVCLVGLNFNTHAQRSILPDGDTLVYNGGTGQWVRHPLSGGGGVYSSFVPVYKADSSITYYTPRQVDSLLAFSPAPATKWVKTGTYRYNFFSTVLPRNDTFKYSGYTLPARGVLMAIIIKVDTVFNNSGGPYSYTIGVSDGNGRAMSINFITPQSATSMPASGGYGPFYTNVPGMNYGFESMTSATPLNIVVSSSDFLNNAVQGSMEVYALVGTLP